MGRACYAASSTASRLDGHGVAAWKCDRNPSRAAGCRGPRGSGEVAGRRLGGRDRPAGRRGGLEMTDVVAIDANLFLRHTVRRFLCAMQEVRGGQVPVPAEVLRESVRKYPRIAGSTRTGLVAPCTSGRTGRATSRCHGRRSKPGRRGARPLRRGPVQRYLPARLRRADTTWSLCSGVRTSYQSFALP